MLQKCRWSNGQDNNAAPANLTQEREWADHEGDGNDDATTGEVEPVADRLRGTHSDTGKRVRADSFVVRRSRASTLRAVPPFVTSASAEASSSRVKMEDSVREARGSDGELISPMVLISDLPQPPLPMLRPGSVLANAPPSLLAQMRSPSPPDFADLDATAAHYERTDDLANTHLSAAQVGIVRALRAQRMRLMSQIWVTHQLLADIYLDELRIITPDLARRYEAGEDIIHVGDDDDEAAEAGAPDGADDDADIDAMDVDVVPPAKMAAPRTVRRRKVAAKPRQPGRLRALRAKIGKKAGAAAATRAATSSGGAAKSSSSEGTSSSAAGDATLVLSVAKTADASSSPEEVDDGAAAAVEPPKSTGSEPTSNVESSEEESSSGEEESSGEEAAVDVKGKGKAKAESESEYEDEEEEEERSE